MSSQESSENKLEYYQRCLRYHEARQKGQKYDPKRDSGFPKARKPLRLCGKGYCSARAKFEVYPSAYANAHASAVCSGSKSDYGMEVGWSGAETEWESKDRKRYEGYLKKLQKEGKVHSLRRWFKKEAWVNLKRENKDYHQENHPKGYNPKQHPCHKRYEECGTGKGLENPDEYPYCRAFYLDPESDPGSVVVTVPELLDYQERDDLDESEQFKIREHLAKKTETQKDRDPGSKSPSSIRIPGKVSQKIKEGRVGYLGRNTTLTAEEKADLEKTRTLGAWLHPPVDENQSCESYIKDIQEADTTDRLDRILPIFAPDLPTRRTVDEIRQGGSGRENAANPEFFTQYSKVFAPCQEEGKSGPLYQPVLSEKKKIAVRVRKQDGDEITVHAGHHDYQDYTRHRDSGRRSNYCKRSGGIKCAHKRSTAKEGEKGPCDQSSPNFWARQALWDCAGSEDLDLEPSEANLERAKQLIPLITDLTCKGNMIEEYGNKKYGENRYQDRD